LTHTVDGGPNVVLVKSAHFVLARSLGALTRPAPELSTIA